MQKKSSKDLMWGWFVHGVSSSGKWTSNEQEYFTECLFCQGADKLYINPQKKVFQCKICSAAGNYLKFLELVNALNQKSIQDYHLQILADHRKLPIDAFRGYEIGWNGNRFTIPIRHIDGHMINLLTYKVGEKMMSSPVIHGMGMGLLCAPRLKKHMHGAIWICEGYWDVIAMSWLLKEVEVLGTVVGVPGVNTNLNPWEASFYNKDVVVLYDNDVPAIEAEVKAYQILQTKTKSSAFIHWPEKKPEGYDINDHISKWSFKPEKAYKLIQKWLHEVPREFANMAIKDKTGKLTLEQRSEKLKPISFDELIKVYREYLYLPNIDPVKIMLGTIYANRLRSDMIWMFLVAPPSSGKSELLLSLSGTPETELVTNVSEHTFVSGFIQAGGGDPSLFEKLRDRIMIIKDFTPILNTNPQKQAGVFDILRDAYDGRIDVMFGHGVNRRYRDLRFGILAGVTSAIEKFGQMQQTLGERFLRYYLPFDQANEKHIIKKALGNITREKTQQELLKHAVYRFLETNKNQPMPQRSERINEQIGAIALFTASMRGVVPRDFKDKVQYHPSIEGAARVSKQLCNLAMGLAALEKKSIVGQEEIRLIKEVALSSCPDFVRTTVRVLYNAGKSHLTLREIEEQTSIPVGTLKFVLDDLKLLKLVVAVGTNFKRLYTLSHKSKELIRVSEIYTVPIKKFYFG